MADYYVCGTDGDDGTGTGAIDDAWATLQKAIDNADPGDTIHVSNKAAQTIAAPITWNTGWDNLAAGTSADAPLVITVWDNGGALTISHPYANYDCFEIDGNNQASIFSTTDRPNFVYLVNGKFHNVSAKLIDAGANWAALGCELYDNGSGYLWDVAYYQLVAGCYLHTFPASAIGLGIGNYGSAIGNYIVSPSGAAITAATSATIRDNIIRNAASHGVNVAGDAAKIHGNTIQGDGSTSAAGINLGAAHEQVEATNNIIVDFAGTGHGIKAASGSNFRLIGHNHYHNNNTNEDGVVVKGLDLGNNVTTDPGFVDAAGGDFRIGLAGRNKAWPMGWPGSDTLNSLDIGAVQAIMGRRMRL